MHRGQEEKECWLKGSYAGAGKEDWRLVMVIWRTGYDLQLLHMINLGDCCEKHLNTLAAIIGIVINRLFFKATFIQKAGIGFPCICFRMLCCLLCFR